MQIAFINSPLGITKIVGDENGISIICFASLSKAFSSTFEEGELSKTIPNFLKEAVNQLKEYFDGNRTEFTFKLNPKGTDFQQKVWRGLLEIPFGKTMSYLELSKKLGDVKAIRAVASANGKNPLWIVIPCHRIIGTDDSLTGYAGGLWRKKWLLEHENPTNQQRLF